MVQELYFAQQLVKVLQGLPRTWWPRGLMPCSGWGRPRERVQTLTTSQLFLFIPFCPACNATSCCCGMRPRQLPQLLYRHTARLVKTRTRLLVHFASCWSNTFSSLVVRHASASICHTMCVRQPPPPSCSSCRPSFMLQAIISQMLREAIRD